MSTQSTYTFKASSDQEQDHHVFVHWDGYPSNALKMIKKALLSAWLLPRYESDEFAASFVAANKTQEGGVRLMREYDDVQGVDYHYEVSLKDNEIHVSFEEWVEDNDEDVKVSGPLDKLIADFC